MCFGLLWGNVAGEEVGVGDWTIGGVLGFLDEEQGARAFHLVG
jgi:hypothetical protein